MPRVGDRKYTAAESEDKLRIYVFVPKEIDTLEELDLVISIGKSYNLGEFWVSRYEEPNDKFKDIFVFKCLINEKTNVS